jgi:nucleotide-binding universal stress UspA family protein
MSGSVVVAVVALWVVIGLVLSFAMGHRGHDRFSWLVLGWIMGPAAIALALVSWRAERLRPQIVKAPPPAGTTDGIDVLVGFDGSVGSRGAVDGCLALLGGRLGRLTLVSVVPFDGGSAAEREAEAMLQAEGERLSSLGPGLEVAHGDPAHALEAAARRGGYDLVVIGTRGPGHSHVSGSVAVHLARTSAVPVLLSPAPGVPPAGASVGSLATHP